MLYLDFSFHLLFLGYLGRRVDDLSKSVTDMLVRQKQVRYFIFVVQIDIRKQLTILRNVLIYKRAHDYLYFSRLLSVCLPTMRLFSQVGN